MHCISSYPCDDQNVNLKRIEQLKKISPLIGLSDHTPDILSSLFSLPYGVDLIEKHFTINNKLPGRDNKFAILPRDLKDLRDKVDRFTFMEKKANKLTDQGPLQSIGMKRRRLVVEVSLVIVITTGGLVQLAHQWKKNYFQVMPEERKYDSIMLKHK